MMVIEFDYREDSKNCCFCFVVDGFFILFKMKNLIYGVVDCFIGNLILF